MSPPSFSDVGKKAEDVAFGGFRPGVLDFRLKTRSESGVEVTSGGSASIGSNGDAGGRIKAETQLKFTLDEYGLSLKEKWVSAKSPKYCEDTLKTDVCLENSRLLLPGSKLTLESSYAPASGSRKEKVKASLKRDSFHLNSSLTFPASKGSLALTLAHRGFVFGFRSPLAMTEKLSGDFALGFSSKDFEASTKCLENGDRFCASLFHRVNARVTTGFLTSWNRANGDSAFSLGAEYAPDDEATMKLSVDHASKLGLAFYQKLGHGLSLSASAMIDGKKIKDGDHKIGFGFDFDLS